MNIGRCKAAKISIQVIKLSPQPVHFLKPEEADKRCQRS
jgi:hypothetical protein